MKIALIGATGFIGQHILAEAINRQHQVTALVRDTSKVAQHPQVNTKALDSNDSPAVTAA
ncbi:MAG TPA: NAD(P)H-binding protein, partial [Cellvibrio sp.]